METFLTDDDDRTNEYRFGVIIYRTKERTLHSMLSARTIRLTLQEHAFLSFLAARMGTVAAPEAHASACAMDPEGKRRPDRHHLRVLAERVRDKLEWIAEGASRHTLTFYRRSGEGYILVSTEQEVEELRRTGIYLTREDFKHSSR